MHTKLWSRNLKGRDHSEDLGVDGSIRMYLREIGGKFGGWIYLAQDRDRSRALVQDGNETSGPTIKYSGGGGIS
jgi:hypothetical protein